jgi:hypothetical protein
VVADRLGTHVRAATRAPAAATARGSSGCQAASVAFFRVRRFGFSGSTGALFRSA